MTRVTSRSPASHASSVFSVAVADRASIASEKIGPPLLCSPMFSQSLARNVLNRGRSLSTRVRKSSYPFLVAWPGSVLRWTPETPCLFGQTPLAIVHQPTSLMVAASGGA